MSWSLLDMPFRGAQYLTSTLPQSMADVSKTYAEIPQIEALTTKAQMEAEQLRIQTAVRKHALAQMQDASQTGGADNQYPPGYDPNQPAGGDGAVVPPGAAPAAAVAPAVVPGADTGFGAAAPPPRAAPGADGSTATARAAPSGAIQLAQAGEGGAPLYSPGYKPIVQPTATGSAALMAQAAPPPGPQPPPPAPAPAPAPPAQVAQAPAAAAPAPAAPAVAPGSTHLAANPGSPAGTSPNGVMLGGVGPVSKRMAADYWLAIANGQDAASAAATIASQRYVRLAEIAGGANSPADWNTRVLGAWREGLIDNNSANQLLGHWDKKDQFVNSLMKASEQVNAEVARRGQGLELTPHGVTTSQTAQQGTEGMHGAAAAGEGRLVDVKVWNDPNDPTKGYTIQQTPAPGVYRFLQEHTGSELMSQGGPDPVASMPKSQALAAIMQRESSGRNIETQIKNANGTPASTASGYYQMTDDTWHDAAAAAGIKNPPARAMMASRADQDAAASALWDKRGAQPWLASNPNLRTSAAAPATRAAPIAPIPQRVGLGGGGNAPMGQPGGAPAVGPIAAATVGAAPGTSAVAQAVPPAARVQVTPPPPASPSSPVVAGANRPYVVGDSIAQGVQSAGRLDGNTHVGDNPTTVLAKIKNTPAAQVSGKDVVLSSGASNDHSPQQMANIEEQVRTLKTDGAKSVKLLGVGPGGGGDQVNRTLAMIAGRTGAEFVPLTGSGFTGDGVHLQNYGPLTQQLTTAEAAAAGGEGGGGVAARTGGYDVASLGNVPPPTMPSRAGVIAGVDTGAPPTATQAQYLGLPPGPVRTMPSEWHPGPAVADAIETDKKLRDTDAAEMPAIQKDVLAGQTAMRTMQDAVRRLNMVGGFPGAASGTRVTVGQFLKDFGPQWAEKIGAAIGGDKFDPSKVDQVRILAKELFQMSINQEQGLTTRGGAQLTELFNDMLPNIGMSKNAISDMTNVMQVMQQARLDYLQGAQQHYGRERMWLPMQRDAQGGLQRYHPLSEWDMKYNDPEGKYSPHTYVGAAAVLNGGDDWREGLNKKQQGYAIQAAMRAHPGAVLNSALIPKRYGGDAND